MKHISTDMFGSVTINSLKPEEAEELYMYLLEAISMRRNGNRPQSMTVQAITHELGELKKRG